MLEASRTGMSLMTAMLLLLFIHKSLNEGVDFQMLLKQIQLILIPLILALIFQKSIKSAVDRYTKNIEAHYELMFEKV